MDRIIYLCYSAELHNFITEYVKTFIDVFDGRPLIVDYDNSHNNYSDNNIYIFIQQIPDVLLLNPIKYMYLINIEQTTVPKYNYMINDIIEKKIKVIDYSIENIKILGNEILHLPYQYVDSDIDNLRNYINQSDKEYDIVIFGDLNPRRQYIYDELVKKDIRVLHLNNIWGVQQDIKISTAKILLNIHFDDTHKIYESLNYDKWTFANMLIISEESLYHNILDVNELIIFENYDNIINKIIDVLNNYSEHYIQFIETYNKIIDTVKANRVKALHDVLNDILSNTDNFEYISDVVEPTNFYCIKDVKEDIIENNITKNNIIENKLEESTIEIFSANWVVNGGKQSFVKLGDKNIFLSRGYNLFGIKGDNIFTLATFDGCIENWAESIQTYIKNMYDKIEYDYLIFVTHDDVTNKTPTYILQNYLIFLECKQLRNLQFRGSYLMIYDLRKRKILCELCDNKFPIHEWFELVKNHDDNNYELENLGVPVYLIIYNLLYFTKRSIEQLQNYTKNIHIIDNRSTYPKLLEYYDNEYKYFLHKMDVNHGHEVWVNEMFWQFPKYFVISDPDLEFNKNMPPDVLNILKTLSDKYKKGKVGFALDISDAYLFYQNNNYFDAITIENWEKQFWVNRIDNPDYVLYDAKIDTTFCIINKEYMSKQNKLDGVRIAGDFTCKHIPWYEGWYKLLEADEWTFFRENNISSSTLQLISKIQENNNNRATLLFKDVSELITDMGEFIPKLEGSNDYITSEYIEENDINEVKIHINNCIDILTKYKVKVSNSIVDNFKNKI
jgi:hypothetical protein